jgi:hypothetical protein
MTQIPENVQAQIRERIERFNGEVIQDAELGYVPRFREQYVYLDRNERRSVSHIGRLTYNGDVDDMAFAIYKYSSERYAPDEQMFPGSEELDGTVEGAMHAGLIAYPDLDTSVLELANLFALKDPFESSVASGPAPRPVGRNDPCPCGSGKKYKRCCGRKGRR